MSQTAFFETLRELARCYQRFECFAAHDIRQFELTPAQFDIIATLGNTEGMTPKQLCEKTLITKGTLTGVVDRLIAKSLLSRQQSKQDGRSFIICLTPAGQTLFEHIFPLHIKTLQHAFANFSEKDFQTINASLRQLSSAFTHPDSSHLKR